MVANSKDRVSVLSNNCNPHKRITHTGCHLENHSQQPPPALGTTAAAVILGTNQHNRHRCNHTTQQHCKQQRQRSRHHGTFHSIRVCIFYVLYLEGEAAEGDNLVEEDPVAPHVRHGGEEAVSQALRRHPPHRQHPCTTQHHFSRCFLMSSSISGLCTTYFYQITYTDEHCKSFGLLRKSIDIQVVQTY